MMQRAALAVGSLLSAAIVAGAQEPQPFRGGAEGIRVDVHVTSRGRSIPDLTAKDFVLKDNGVTQTIDVSALKDAPLRVCLLLDTSGSLDGRRLAHLANAAQSVVATLRERDQVALFTFTHVLQRMLDYSEDRSRVAEALQMTRPGSPTAMRDALFGSLQLLPRDGVRTVVLAFTDGIDNTSWLTADDIKTAAVDTDAVVHIVHLVPSAAMRDITVPPGGFQPSLRRPGAGDAALLEDITRATGGRYWRIDSAAALSANLIGALDDMRSRYLLSYSTPVPNATGWHTLDVRVPARRVEITARPRYWVPER